ncbi:MAG TPA: PqqD family protein [bacterium]|nr:PqqD family protein [bacterium]
MEMLNKYPIKSNDIASRILDGEAVVVLPMDSIVYTFDPVGTRIWDLITGNEKFFAIIKTIQNEYDVPAATAEQDTVEFINELVAKKMLILSELPDDRA